MAVFPTNIFRLATGRSCDVKNSTRPIPGSAFSVASMGHHWTGGKFGYEPKTVAAVENQKLVQHARQLAEILNPRYGFLIENPRGMLRKLDPIKGLTQRTVSYCQYGDDRMKPTDLWGDVPGWTARQVCRNGDPCHVPAPRGSMTGTQGRKGARIRSMVPYDLGSEIREAITRHAEQNGQLGSTIKTA